MTISKSWLKNIHFKAKYNTHSDFVKEFNLDDTPCQLVFNNEIILIDKDVSLNFKKDARFGMESFLGLPMLDEKGECFGHLAIMSKEKKAFSQIHIYIAKIFLGRISSEMKRNEIEKENKKIYQELYKQTITDSLTKLHNRHYFQEKANEIFTLVKRSICSASLIIFDIDNFKQINDKFGHPDGDIVLKNIGEILLVNSRKDIDFIFRIGGEEFAIISLNNSYDDIIQYCNKITLLIKESFKNKKYKVTISVGVNDFNKNDISWQDTYRISDQRLYQAKNSGKDQIISK